MTEYPALDRFLLTDLRDVAATRRWRCCTSTSTSCWPSTAGVLPVPATLASRHTCSRADRATTTTKAC